MLGFAPTYLLQRTECFWSQVKPRQRKTSALRKNASENLIIRRPPGLAARAVILTLVKVYVPSRFSSSSCLKPWAEVSSGHCGGGSEGEGQRGGENEGVTQRTGKK